jgi:hypothetical protein
MEKGTYIAMKRCQYTFSVGGRGGRFQVMNVGNQLCPAELDMIHDA